MNITNANLNTVDNTLNGISEISTDNNVSSMPSPGAVETTPALESGNSGDVQKGIDTVIGRVASLHQEVGSPAGSSGNKGLVHTIGNPDIAGSGWSIMENINLQQRLGYDGMRFATESELSEVKNSLFAGATDILTQLEHALPNSLEVGKDGSSSTYLGLAAADWGIAISGGVETNW